MEALSRWKGFHRLERCHRQHPSRKDGEFGHPDLPHLAMELALVLEPVQQLPAYYSRKPLLVRSHRVLVQLT